MDETEGFDRLAFLSNRRLTALGAPRSVAEGFGLGATLEDVFVSLEEAVE